MIDALADPQTLYVLGVMVSYRDIEELLEELGVIVDHVTVCQWVPPITDRRSTAVSTCARRSFIRREPAVGVAARPLVGVKCAEPTRNSMA